MTENRRKPKEIHVDKLIVHAKEVEIIHERKEHHDRFNPWVFGPRRDRDEVVEGIDEENDDSKKEHHEDHNDRRRPFWM